jgi:hypothetical protein
MKRSVSITLQVIVSAAGCWFAMTGPVAEAVFFDLRGLTPSQNTSLSLTVGGITAQLGSVGNGKFQSGANTFGIDINNVSDDPALIDGGGGSAESFAFLFSQNVLFESLLISHFDSVDHGSFNIKGGGTITLANGVNEVGMTTGGSSANFLRWTGDTSTGGGRGFSVDGFTVRLLGNGAALPGDFDGSGRVDDRDYVIWRNALGTSYTQSDYNLWRGHFGESNTASAASAFLAVVP